MAKSNKHDELRLVVNSRYPDYHRLETPEEERFEQMLLEVAMEAGKGSSVRTLLILLFGFRPAKG